jgi:ubiquitin carboxyl-terminal hydrolase 14
LQCHFVRFFWRREISKKTKIMRKVTFPFELDATEFCSDELKAKLIPVRDTLRDLHKDASDRERARKRMKLQVDPADVAGGNAGEGGFGSTASTAAHTHGIIDVVQETQAKEAAANKAKAEEAEPDWNEVLKDKLDPEIMKDEGCNPSGLYELFAVVTHQGASADSGHYCAYVKKENGDGKTWYFFNDDNVTEVDQSKIETLYGGGMFPCLST